MLCSSPESGHFFGCFTLNAQNSRKIPIRRFLRGAQPSPTHLPRSLLMARSTASWLLPQGLSLLR